MTFSHPEPPADLSSMRLVIKKFTGGWYRIHDAGHDVLHFGRQAAHRFDAADGTFGVLYVARDVHGAFIETFGHETGRVPFVTESELRNRGVAALRPRARLRLVDLRGEGLPRIGADAGLTNGADVGLSRRWASALHDHPRKPDGIAYRARHDPARTSAALFDRARDLLAAKAYGGLLERRHERLLADILDTYGYGLVAG